MPMRQDKSEPTASSAKNIGYGFLLFAVFTGALAPVNHDWYAPLGWAIASAGMLAVGSGRIYRPALTRTAEAITCRYDSWREGSLYLVLVVLPGIGLATIHSDTAIVRLAGVAAFVLVPIGLLLQFGQGRRCWLRISPDALTVPVPAFRYAATVIPREAIGSITAGTGRRRQGDTGPVTQIAYLPDGPAPVAPATVLIGPTNSTNAVWLTIEQADLVDALQRWHNTDPRDPTLLDRVEATLRGEASPGRSPEPPGLASDTAGPVPPPGYPPPPAAEPSRWRWLSLAAVGVAALIGAAATPFLRNDTRASDPPPGITSAPPPAGEPGCPVAGAAVRTLPKKSDAEPTIHLPLAPGWAGLPDTAPADSPPTVRAYLADDALRANDFTPFLQVDLTRTTGAESGSAIADELYAKAGAMMTISDRSVATVCGTTVYRADISGYNPDGKGPQSGFSVFTVVEGKGGVRWIAIASIKTRNPDSPGYLAQRDALAGGFHAGFP